MMTGSKNELEKERGKLEGLLSPPTSKSCRLSNKNKKRNKPTTATATDVDDNGEDRSSRHSRGDEGTEVFCGQLPREVIALIAQYCTRGTLANLMRTSKGNYSIINNPNFVPVWPWPTMCPPFLTPAEDARGYAISYASFSKDGMFLVVHIDEKSPRTPGRIQVWCQRRGRLLELRIIRAVDIFAKPVFSPDSKLLMLPSRRGDSVRIVQLPATSFVEKPPRVHVTTHALPNNARANNARDARLLRRKNITFLGDNKVAASERFSHAINILPIMNRDNDEIRINTTPDEIIIRDQLAVGDPELHLESELASFNGTNKNFLAWNYAYTMAFHDLARGVTASVAFPHGTVDDLAFSRDGRSLAAASRGSEQDGITVSIFNCNVERVEDITVDPREFHFGTHRLDFCGCKLSFSMDNSKVAIFTIVHGATAQSSPSITRKVHWIELQTGETVSEEWSDSSWLKLL